MASGIEAESDSRHSAAVVVQLATGIDLSGPLAGNAGGLGGSDSPGNLHGLLRKLDQLNTYLHDAIFIGVLFT